MRSQIIRLSSARATDALTAASAIGQSDLAVWAEIRDLLHAVDQRQHFILPGEDRFALVFAEVEIVRGFTFDRPTQVAL